MIKSALEGETLKALSKTFSRSHTTVQDWINRFREGGVERLLDKRKGNDPASKLTPEMEAGMRAELAKGKWRTARDAWKWLSENHDVSELKESVIYKYLGKCEGRLKATRPCTPKKDQAQEDAFRVELADKMQSLEIPSDKNVRLWVYDEMRYGFTGYSPCLVKCGVFEAFERFLHPEYVIRMAIYMEQWRSKVRVQSFCLRQTSTNNGILTF